MPFRLAITLLMTIALSVASADSITVSAAISLKDAMAEISPAEQKASGDQIQFNFGASGVLAAQISEGAPADAFISAAREEMDQLASLNLIDAASRRDVCSNELVVIVPTDAAFTPGSFSELADPRIARLAMGEPRIVPAGRYAYQVLDHLHIGPSLSSRLVWGQNVRQVLDFVQRGEVDAGIVYSSDAVAAGGKVKVAARAAESLHEPIVYPAAVTKSSAHAQAARRFLDFLSSAPARKILSAHGFVVSAPTTAPSP